MARRSGFEFAAGVKRALLLARRRQRRLLKAAIDTLSFTGAARRAAGSAARKQAGNRGSARRARMLADQGQATAAKVAKLEAKLARTIKPRALNKEIARQLDLHPDYVRKLRRNQRA